MANENYTFFDASASVQTAAASSVNGALQPLVQISSFLTGLSVTPSGNQSVSGTVNIAGNPSISGTVQIAGNPSISGTVQVGNFPTSQNVNGSVVAFQGTDPWIITGSVQGAFSPSGNQSVSGTVGASVIGHAPVFIVGGSVATATTNSSVMLLNGANAIGSVAVLQGTNPFIITGSVQGAFSPSGNQSVSGTVDAAQIGTYRTSVISSAPSSMLVGSYGFRNDAVASFLGGNLSWNQFSTDSAGRTLIRPFAPEESRVEGYNSVVSTSVTTLVPAAGTGLRNYITDVWVANTGAAATLVTFRSGGGTSVLGYTIAPAGGGSNLPGLQTPIRTLANETFDIQATTATSILFATVKGFKAP